ncbi:MAG: HAMP domain-containing histidine kinase [Myxococcaceae bacterium]|nr:HAMP domain-containing histidine kinase [Myxococcaceae bacterium]
MRSARVAIAAAALVLVLMPFALLLVAWLYEGAIITSYEHALQRTAHEAAHKPVGEWRALGEREGVWLRRVHASGVDDAGAPPNAVSSSEIGGFVESVAQWVGAGTPLESLRDIDAPLAGRAELESARRGTPMWASRASESGQTMVVSYAEALPDGSVLLATRATHRGVRQLLLARRQLMKLVLYQTFFAFIAALLLGRWLVKPLERLTGRALVYPVHAIADPSLLARRDEVGQLARAFDALTRSLEDRRRQTVDLAADIAHEFKNPLATIATAAELAATTKNPEALSGVVTTAVERLRRTTDALLNLVRLESALVDAPRDALDYAAWVDALLDTYRSDPQHEGWRFELEASPGIGTVHVAAEAWASMLRNLVDNARVQPSASKRVRVRVRREGGQLVTEVTDFGPGVSEGNRAKVFERFFTARPEGVERGTGLGLAIVRTVAEAHGGSVELLPALSGEGATFRVVGPELPRSATPLPHAVPPQSSGGAA